MEKHKEDSHARGGAQGFPRVHVQLLNMTRKILITILISTLLAVPIIGQLNFNVYAESSSVVTREEAKEAFRAYCISRNLLVDGSVLGSAASWLGNAFDNAITTLGIDMDEIQTELSKVYSGNGFKWAFTASGIALYNRIFAELLQREDLEIDDTDVNKLVYSGDTFIDSEGNKCMVYYVDSPSSYSGNVHTPLKFGTPYKYTSSELYSMQGQYASYTPYAGKTFRDYITPQFADNFANFVNFTGNYIGTQYEYKMLIRATRIEDGRIIRSGHRAIFNYNGGYYFGHFLNVIDASPVDPNISAYYWTIFENPFPIGDDDVEPTDVTVKTPDNKKILPDPSENPTVINPDGTTDDDPDIPDNPIIPPDDPDAPTGGTPPDWSTDTDVEPDGDGWKIPFNLPDLDIDWSIDGLGSKFPFCIPRDLVALVGVLNVEPVAPHFTGTVDLLIYDWQVNIDFSEFDAIGVIVRNGLFILFCIGLLVATRAIIRG